MLPYCNVYITLQYNVTEVCDIVQQRGSKTIPKKNKCKKEKWLSDEALQITVRRREAKNKEEKERYTHWNAECQRIARRHKKAFLNDQCKEIEETIEWERLEISLRFHTMMSTIKDRNGRDLTEAEDIK